MQSPFRLPKTLWRHLCSSSRRFLATDMEAVRQAVKKFGAPATIGLIEDLGLASPNAVAFIREIGCTRRVFLLNPYFTSDELEGLAYRIRVLTKNEGINSVLIATDHRVDEDSVSIPSILWDRNHLNDHLEDSLFPPESGKTFHVSAGYDPLELYKSGQYKNREYVNTLMQRLTDLTNACAGHAKHTKIPTICVPHGLVTDGGYAFLRSSYVLSTLESSFRILNPSRGLSLDPVGLSFYLTRLGQEFQQPAAAYPGCGLILALTGYEADSADIMATGLATHNIDTTSGLGTLEAILAELPSWEHQAILKQPKRYHGQEVNTSVDHNAFFRNYVVADCIDTFAGDRADGRGWMQGITEEKLMRAGAFDPSLEPDPSPLLHVERRSMLVDYAATFDSIFQSHSTVQGLLEGLREIGSRHTDDPLEQEGISVAADLAARLQRQSPLALSVIHQLLLMALPQRNPMTATKEEILQNCLQRERWVQTNMYQQEDFARWAEYTVKHPTATEPFTKWKHPSLAHVTGDEVEEIFAAPEGERPVLSYDNLNKPPAIPPSPQRPPIRMH